MMGLSKVGDAKRSVSIVLVFPDVESSICCSALSTCIDKKLYSIICTILAGDITSYNRAIRPLFLIDSIE